MCMAGQSPGAKMGLVLLPDLDFVAIVCAGQALELSRKVMVEHTQHLLMVLNREPKKATVEVSSSNGTSRDNLCAGRAFSCLNVDLQCNMRCSRCCLGWTG